MIVIYFERKRSRYTAMALIPPIILFWKRKSLHDYRIYKHECIHHRQIIELLILPFFVWYGVEYLVYRIKGYRHFDAYKNIVFEKEAYLGESIPRYASGLNWYGFLKHYQKKSIE